MLFSSIPFLYYFLPAVIICYFLISKLVGLAFKPQGEEKSYRASIFTKNLILLLFSLLFYGWGEPVYVFLMIGSILMFWLCGLAIGKATTKRWKRIWLIVSVALSLSALGVFKYADFFIDNFNKLTGLNVKLLKLALPIGISFYTFQCLSYTIDVYRNDVPAQKDPIAFGAYDALFPQLIAGPIVRYIDVARELKSRTHTLEKTYLGMRRFLIGLGKKIIIADNIALMLSIFRESAEPSVVFYWMYAIGFMLNIYFDFSGYSDMAIGLGKIFGFNFIENFNYPYMSKSVAEFWRRWHMSLGSWFRDYVYIPLGGNRVKKLRWLFNTFVVWFLTGMWHGASWNFILWGLLYAVCLLIEKFIPAIGKLPSVLRRFYTLFVVCIGFVLFNADSANVNQLSTFNPLNAAWNDLRCMFGFGGLPFVNATTLYYLRSYLVVLVVAIIGATPLMKNTANRLSDSKRFGTATAVLAFVLMAALLLICTAYMVDGSFSPFLYFRF